MKAHGSLDKKKKTEKPSFGTGIAEVDLLGEGWGARLVRDYDDILGGEHGQRRDGASEFQPDWSDDDLWEHHCRSHCHSAGEAVDFDGAPVVGVIEGFPGEHRSDQ